MLQRSESLAPCIQISLPSIDCQSTVWYTFTHVLRGLVLLEVAHSNGGVLLNHLGAQKILLSVVHPCSAID